MFFRKKKVGRNHYFEIVESQRIKTGPRLKILASLGRADKLMESGGIDSLAKSLSSLAQNFLLLDKNIPGDIRQISDACFQGLVLERMLSMDRLDQNINKVFSGGDKIIGLTDALGMFMFRGAPKNATMLSDTLQYFGIRRDISSLFPDRMPSKNSTLFIRIGAHSALGASSSFLSGITTATAMNDFGNILAVQHWFSYLPLADMIAKHVGLILQQFPNHSLILILDRSHLKKPLLNALNAATVRYVVPFREPQTLLMTMPDRISELGKNLVPIPGIINCRMIRAVDQVLETKDRQTSSAQKAQIESALAQDPKHARQHREALGRLEQRSAIYGTTLLLTNLKTDMATVVDAYLLGLKALEYTHHVNAFSSRLTEIPHSSRTARNTIEGIFELGIFADYLTSKLSDRVSSALGAPATWEAIRNAIIAHKPTFLGQGLEGGFVFYGNSPILTAVLKTLKIDREALLSLEDVSKST